MLHLGLQLSVSLWCFLFIIANTLSKRAFWRSSIIQQLILVSTVVEVIWLIATIDQSVNRSFVTLAFFPILRRLLILAPTLTALKRCSQAFFLLLERMKELFSVAGDRYLVTEWDNFLHYRLLFFCKVIHAGLQSISFQCSYKLGILKLSSSSATITSVTFFILCIFVLSFHAIEISLEFLYLLFTLKVHSPSRSAIVTTSILQSLFE